MSRGVRIVQTVTSGYLTVQTTTTFMVDEEQEGKVDDADDHWYLLDTGNTLDADGWQHMFDSMDSND